MEFTTPYGILRHTDTCRYYSKVRLACVRQTAELQGTVPKELLGTVPKNCSRITRQQPAPYPFHAEP